MKVIAISGHARNGKDTVAQMLQKQLREDGYTVLITHYADLLKYVKHSSSGMEEKMRKDALCFSMLVQTL